MVDAVVLSKIAVLINKDVEHDEQIIQNRFIFQYNQKQWQLLEVFASEGDTLLEIIQICLNEKFKNVSFAESENGNFLTVQYNNFLQYRRSKCDEATIDKLFAILYPRFSQNRDCCKEDAVSVKDTPMLKAYVTTKLFDALQKLHCCLGESQYDDDRLKLPSKFLPSLCRYQRKSVLWLLRRETLSEIIPAFFERLLAKDDESVVYKHLYCRYVQTDAPPSVTLPPGGILADEMGLGKTVETLALILLNARKDDTNTELEMAFQNFLSKRRCLQTEVFCICTSKSKSKIVQCTKCSLWQHTKCIDNYRDECDVNIDCPYFCPSCWQHLIREFGLIKSKGTFIVSPSTIKLQWLSEIRRHIQPTLQVFLYDGVSTGKWICPSVLAKYDVVLADYNVLRQEIYYTSENDSERTTRNKPRSMRMYSPLLMIEWWRVCLDEAQMVESNTSKISALVHMIPAINRWAVTGTPIQRSLYDLQPLLKFVGFDMAAEPTTWNCLVHTFLLNYNSSLELDALPLVKVLQKCMWRTDKLQIADELKIPPQKETVHYINFDNLEQLFYKEQHADCKDDFQRKVLKYTKRMATAVTPKIMKIILQPFLKIRQSCTMPVVVTSSHTNSAVVSQQKQFLQPKELHDYLKSANEISCKSELRAIASSHNGLAAIYFIQQEYDEAIRHYEAVLRLATEYTDMNITVDSLLQIHALHNFMEIKKYQNVSLGNPNLEPYEAQYNSLEWKYLATYSATLTAVTTSYKAALDKIESHTDENVITAMSEGLCSLQETEIVALLQKIYEECMPRFGSTNVKLTEIRSVQSLLYVLDLWFTKLKSLFLKIDGEMIDLKYFTGNVKPRSEIEPDVWIRIQALVNSVYDCHLSEIRENERTKKKISNAPKKKKKCRMCVIRDNINSFECMLFDKVIDKTSNCAEGMENPSFEMFLLSLSYLKSKASQMTMNGAYEECGLYLEALLSVCKRLIKLWIEMEYTIKAYDELNMCKMRLTLTEDQDDKSSFKIQRHEIEQRIIDHQTELFSGEREFAKKLARLKYINHLTKNEDIGACPICQHVEQDRYAVLECGHHICLQCLRSIRQLSKSLILKCSVCRNIQQNRESYAKKQEDCPVKGTFSSKISYIVRVILTLQKQEHEDNVCDDQSDCGNERNLKILIFSQWTQILKAIGVALKENDITFRIHCTPKIIEDFKNPCLGITCLLMPFVKGSKGLNLVEATHVFLVEPILNPGEELQAIGRVHRFGQKRSTTIHRFIMKDSIEENIIQFISSSLTKRNGSSNVLENKWEFENVSLEDFAYLFTLNGCKDFQ